MTGPRIPDTWIFMELNASNGPTCQDMCFYFYEIASCVIFLLLMFIILFTLFPFEINRNELDWFI